MTRSERRRKKLISCSFIIIYSTPSNTLRVNVLLQSSHHHDCFISFHSHLPPYRIFFYFFLGKIEKMLGQKSVHGSGTLHKLAHLLPTRNISPYNNLLSVGDAYNILLFEWRKPFFNVHTTHDFSFPSFKRKNHPVRYKNLHFCRSNGIVRWYDQCRRGYFQNIAVYSDSFHRPSPFNTGNSITTCSPLLQYATKKCINS